MSLKNEYGAKLKIRFDTQDLGEVANISGVRWIEPAPVWQYYNDEAAKVMGVPDVWNPGGLRGTGQVVAVADSGLDKGVKDAGPNLHDDFEDGSGNSRVSAIFKFWADDSDGPKDTNGHGTHVAGSVLGNGAGSGYAGIAQKA